MVGRWLGSAGVEGEVRWVGRKLACRARVGWCGLVWAGGWWTRIVSGCVGVCRVVAGRVVAGGVGRGESFSRAVEAAQRRTVDREREWADRQVQAASTAQHSINNASASPTSAARESAFRLPPSAPSALAPLRCATQPKSAPPPMPSRRNPTLPTAACPPRKSLPALCATPPRRMQRAAGIPRPATLRQPAPACTRTHTPPGQAQAGLGLDGATCARLRWARPRYEAHGNGTCP
jgi:hypothetical protein